MWNNSAGPVSLSYIMYCQVVQWFLLIYSHFCDLCIFKKMLNWWNMVKQPEATIESWSRDVTCRLASDPLTSETISHWTFLSSVLLKNEACSWALLSILKYSHWHPVVETSMFLTKFNKGYFVCTLKKLQLPCKWPALQGGTYSLVTWWPDIVDLLKELCRNLEKFGLSAPKVMYDSFSIVYLFVIL